MKTSSNTKTLEQASCGLLGPLAVALFAALADFEAAAVPIAPGELVAPKFEIAGGTLNFTVQPSVAGRSYQLQYSETLEGASWLNLGGVVSGDGNNLVMTTPYLAGVSPRFFRLALNGASVVPDGFVLIPAGNFMMGDQSNPLVGYSDELPVHSVQVGAFYMAKYETSKELWDEVRAWGMANGRGYTDLAVGNGSYASKGINHPVHSISWYDMVKWCNARSEKESLTPCYTVSGATYKTGQNSAVVCNFAASGYRLPTEAEWEKAARGGLNGKLFPWGDTISQSQANYYAFSGYIHDLSGAVNNFHPTYAVGDNPFSSPVGSFASEPNYGLYDMSGNMWEWCWDRYGSYTADSQTNPQGSPSGSVRVFRGGSWINYAVSSCVAARYYGNPGFADFSVGFRMACSLVP